MQGVTRYRGAIGAQQGECGPAGSTGNRLCMMAAGGGVGILVFACTADGKCVHPGTLPVIGQTANDTVAGAAVHTGGGPVSLVSAARGEYVPDAFVTGGNIRRDKTGEGARCAFEDRKSSWNRFI